MATQCSRVRTLFATLAGREMAGEGQGGARLCSGSGEAGAWGVVTPTPQGWEVESKGRERGFLRLWLEPRLGGPSVPGLPFSVESDTWKHAGLLIHAPASVPRWTLSGLLPESVLPK